MSQADYSIANAPGASVRADINSQLPAIATKNSGNNQPNPMFPFMEWEDTTSGLVKKRNSSNTGWLQMGEQDKVYGNSFPSGTKMLFYQDTAPIGWTIQNTLDDKLVFVTKGSAAGGQTGGGVHSTGSWTISGLTGPSHTHTMANHKHAVPFNFQDNNLYAAISNVFGESGEAGTWDRHEKHADVIASLGYGTTNVPTNNTTEAGGTEAVNSNGTWRTASYCCIIALKD